MPANTGKVIGMKLAGYREKHPKDLHWSRVTSIDCTMEACKHEDLPPIQSMITLMKVDLKAELKAEFKAKLQTKLIDSYKEYHHKIQRVLTTRLE